jgi:putative oxidoreductase
MLENPFLRLLETLYNPLVKIGSNLQSFFLLYMRLVWGHHLFIFGTDKLKNMQDTIQFFTDLELSSPFFHAYEVALVEAVCGILIFIGLASRLASIPVIIVMLTALVTAHSEYIGDLEFLKDPHMLVIQEPYPYLVLGLLIFIFGPGKISIDGWIKRWANKQPRY